MTKTDLTTDQVKGAVEAKVDLFPVGPKEILKI